MFGRIVDLDTIKVWELDIILWHLEILQGVRPLTNVRITQR